MVGPSGGAEKVGHEPNQIFLTRVLIQHAHNPKRDPVACPHCVAWDALLGVLNRHVIPGYDGRREVSEGHSRGTGERRDLVV